MSALARTWDYAGKSISSRADEKVNLTDMWRAAGSDPNKRPGDWLRSPSAVEFSNHVADVGFLHVGDLTEIVKGGASGGGNTWAHWHLALAYARYLDHAFHVWCNDVIRREMAGAPTRFDTTVANSARVLDDPHAQHRLRLACKRVCQARSYSLQRVYGFIRKTQRVSSPFALSTHLLGDIIDGLEQLEQGHTSLITRREHRLLETRRIADAKQLRLSGKGWN